MRSKCKKSTLLLLAVMLVAGLITVMPLMTSAEGTETTYNNLYASVQGETNAAAAYRAFAAKAEEEGYPVVARLFRATADAEAKHADDEWAILQGMGATERPTAEMPTVGTTAQNLQAAFDGETYEYTVMYPGFLATAQAEGMSAAVTMFRRAMRAEEVHASNFKDVLDNLGNIAYVNTKYATVYRCLICGEVVTARPASCPICYAAGSTFVMYNQTYFSLYDSVQGETNAAAAYRAFAAKAEEEGYPVVARLFRATADAEAKHADDEWAILQDMGATVKPTAGMPTVGTTAQNLQAAFDGETYEYTVMYPSFLATAQAEGMSAAVTMFRRAMRAEEVHAGNYKDVLDNLGNIAYVNTKYATVYRCLICGEVVTARPTNCPICYAAGSTFVMYNQTYFNLYDSVQGETNAAAAYRAFAAKAEVEGYPVIAQLFNATADAEAKHADDEWAILQDMGATVRPTAAAPTVGTTAQNLQAAFDGETYEYTVMYPSFLATAQAEGMSAAVTMFRRAMRAEEVHAGNYKDVLDNLSNIAYVNTKYATVYRCLICGEVVTARPANCPICYAAGSTFVMYGDEITQYTVTFNSDGGTMVAPQTVNAGACASKPAEPMKDGYTFIGWYENGSDTAYDFETPVMKNLTLTAKWEMQVIIPPIPKVIVNGVEIEIEIKNGVAIVDLTKLTDAMIKQILDGSEIIFDLRDYDKVDIKAPAACFKEYDKTITIKTSGGSGTVKTKTLWNNSGKNRLVSVRNGKVSIDNI